MGLMTETPWESTTMATSTNPRIDFHRANLRNIKKIQQLTKQRNENRTSSQPLKALHNKKFDHVQSRVREWTKKKASDDASSTILKATTFLKGHEKTGPFLENGDEPPKVKRLSGLRSKSKDSRPRQIKAVQPSDYETMSKSCNSIPPVCFDNDEDVGYFCQMSRFAEVTVGERRSRIDNIIAEISANVSLNSGHMTRKSLNQSLRRYASVDQVSDVDSIVSRPKWAMDKKKMFASSPKLNVKKSLIEEKQQKQHVPLRMYRSVPARSVENHRLVPAKLPVPSEKDNRTVSPAPSSVASQDDESTTKSNGESVLLRGFDVDYVKANAGGATMAGHQKRKESSKANEAIEKAKKATTAKMEPPEGYKVGDVPKYIEDRKAEWKAEADRVEKAKPDPDCPAGHRLLPDGERRKVLAEMGQKFDSLLKRMNSFPVRTDTLRSRLEKAEIEAEIRRLEDAITVYERPRVFVKDDAV